MPLKDLDKACLKEKDPKVLKRIQAVRLVEIKIERLGISKTQACKITAEELQMSFSSVRNHIRKYNKHGIEGLRDLPRPGRPPIYPQKQVDKAIASLKKRGGRITPRLLVAGLQKIQKGGPRMSLGHARHVMKARRMSPKKAQHVNVAAAKPREVYRWRAVFIPLILALRALGYTVMVADEMVVLQDANGDAVYWSKISVPVKVPYIGDHDKFVALGTTTEPDKKGRAKRCHVTAEKGNTESFIKLLTKAFKESGPCVVIADRAGWHDSTELKRFLRSMNGKIVVILLPVGSSYMNAKEQDWHQTKLSDFYSEYYSSIGKKMDSTVKYLDTKLNPDIDIWKYLARSPYAYRKGIKRRKKHYGEQGALQYLINKYADPKIVPHVQQIIEKRGSDYVCKI